MAKSKDTSEQKTKKNASALKRLRTSLKEAGVIGLNGKSKGSLSKKQRQGGSTINSNKNQKSDKLSLIKDAFNAFEIKSSKSKYEILGKKPKGLSGRPSLSKQIGLDNRKKTLLVEYRNRNRTGNVTDRRFGENDANMTPEEKMLERFKREKQKKTRNSSLFNLEDDAEEELTHFGQSLAEMDTFDDPIITDDEEDKGVIDKDTVHKSHFGGFEPKNSEDPNRVKSKSEIMKEVMAKSKFYKAERRKEKDADEQMRLELDDELADIRGLLVPANSATLKREPLVPQSALFKKELVEESSNAGETMVPDDYDRHVREMALDIKAHATDRLKTEEEVALEEKAALEKAERHRIRRMNGEDSDTEDEAKVSYRTKNQRLAQGDDLEDDFEESSSKNLGLGEGVQVRVINPSQNDPETNEETDDSGASGASGASSEDGSEESDETFDSIEDGSEESDLDHASDISMEETSSKSFIKTSTKQSLKPNVEDSDEIPFTFPIPLTFEDLDKLVGGRPSKDHNVVIQRSRVLNHIKLLPENKEKMETFLSVLLEYLSCLCSSDYSSELINIYCKHITEISVQIPDAAARSAIQFIRSSHSQYLEELDNRSLTIEYPTAGQLVVFSLFTRLFSTSDYHHSVITPLQIFLGQCLLQSQIGTPRCLAKLVYMCGLCYEMQTEAKRYCPEAIDSLYTVLAALSPSTVKEKLKTNSDFFYNRFQLIENASIYSLIDSRETFDDFSFPKDDPEGTKVKLEFKLLNRDPEDNHFRSAEFLASLFAITLRQLRKFAEMYGSLSSPLTAFPQIFNPLAKTLAELLSSDLPVYLKNCINSHLLRIQSLIKRTLSARYPLQLQNHKPLAIKSFLPKFDADYSVDRARRNPNREKAEFDKLKRQYKREERGAIRELRKDSQFLNRVKLDNVKKSDAEYQAKIRSITGELASVQGDAAKFNYEQKSKKRR